MQPSLANVSLALGAILLLKGAFAFASPQAFTGLLKGFPRNTPIGVVLMLVATGWFLTIAQAESFADFENIKPIILGVFALVGITTCIFVRDFLPARALAVLFLLMAKVMVDAGRPHLAESRLVLVNQYFAYVLIMAGMWLTISPYRLRDWQAQGVWNKIHEVLLARLRHADKIDFKRFIVDTSHVRAVGGGEETGPSPVDRSKTGSKHAILTDGQSVPLVIDTLPGLLG